MGWRYNPAVRWVLLATVLCGCRAPTPVAGMEGVDPPGPLAPQSEPEPKPEPRSNEPVRVHIGGAVTILEEGERPDSRARQFDEGWREEFNDAMATTRAKDVLVTILEMQDMSTVEQAVDHISQRGGRALLWREDQDAEGPRLRLRRGVGSEKPPAGCTRVRLHLEGRGTRVDLEREAGTSRLGRILETSALEGELAQVEPGPCPDIVVELADRNRWSDVVEILPTVYALGATELALVSRTLFARQVYAPYPWSKSLGRVRLNHVLAGGSTGAEGHREYWSVGPARGDAVFEGPLPPWQPESFVLELPAGDYDLDVYGIVNYGGVYHECGTTARVRARRETLLHHNLMYSECTVSAKPSARASDQDRERAQRGRSVTIRRDASRGERKPWVVRVNARDPEPSMLFEFLVPSMMAEMTIPLPAVELDVALREVGLTVDRPTEWCIGSFGGKECGALQAESKHACEARISDSGPQVVTYRPGEGCSVGLPMKRSRQDPVRGFPKRKKNQDPVRGFPKRKNRDPGATTSDSGRHVDRCAETNGLAPEARHGAGPTGLGPHVVKPAEAAGSGRVVSSVALGTRSPSVASSVGSSWYPIHPRSPGSLAIAWVCVAHAFRSSCTLPAS